MLGCNCTCCMRMHWDGSLFRCCCIVHGLLGNGVYCNQSNKESAIGKSIGRESKDSIASNSLYFTVNLVRLRAVREALLKLEVINISR